MKHLVYFKESDYSHSELNALDERDAIQFFIRRTILRSIASHDNEDISCHHRRELFDSGTLFESYDVVYRFYPPNDSCKCFAPNASLLLVIEDMRDEIHERIRLTATKIAESAGAVADVRISTGYPVTYNDPELTAEMLPSLQAAAGAENVKLIKAITGAEDFSFFQRRVPGMYFFLGGMPKGKKVEAAAPHHSPDFYIDESTLKLGVRALSYLTLDYMAKHGK